MEDPTSTLRKSIALRKFPTFMVLMGDIIGSKSSSYEEATSQHLWRDATMEEYASIMKNDLWDIEFRS